MVVLETYSQIAIFVFVGPSNDGFPLPMESDIWFDDLFLKEIYRVAHLLDEWHLVLALALVLNTEIASSKILPTAVCIKLV